jgi:AbiV family abortive infection protein
MSTGEPPETFRFSLNLLKAYSRAALRNSKALLDEARLLLENQHYARAYFLAVSSIEETGKAAQTFAAQGRDLSDPGVTATLVRSTESHSEKITAAFVAWMNAGDNVRNSLMPAVDLMIALKRGREPAMYSNVNRISGELFEPIEVARPTAARDCVKIAENCLAHTKIQLSEQSPAEMTAAQDKMYAMKPGKVNELLNTEDFWWYFISRLENDEKDLAAAVIDYQTHYVAKRRLYAASKAEPDGT